MAERGQYSALAPGRVQVSMTFFLSSLLNCQLLLLLLSIVVVRSALICVPNLVSNVKCTERVALS